MGPSQTNSVYLVPSAHFVMPWSTPFFSSGSVDLSALLNCLIKWSANIKYQSETQAL